MLNAWMKPYTPEVILVISAHWETQHGHALTGHHQPPTIHDFSGFDPALYQIHYPAPGAPQWADTIATRLRAAGFNSAVDKQRGLDHGAWVPLLYLSPAANIPVVQLSLDHAQGPKAHYRLGQLLKPLRNESVLIIGSDGLTHNLPQAFRHQPNDPADPSVEAFVEFVMRCLAQRDFERLIDYRSTHPLGALHHPSEEHLMPLFVVAGASDSGDEWRRHHGGVSYSLLSMDAISAGTP